MRVVAHLSHSPRKHHEEPPWEFAPRALLAYHAHSNSQPSLARARGPTHIGFYFSLTTKQKERNETMRTTWGSAKQRKLPPPASLLGGAVVPAGLAAPPFHCSSPAVMKTASGTNPVLSQTIILY